MLHSAQEVYNYSGIYISYSLSSSSNALKVEPDNPCRQQRPRQSGAHERLQHHTLRHCCLQQPPECLYLLQRTRGAPTGLVHHLPATAHVRLSPPAQRALPLSGLQPQPHSPPHPLHQTLGQHLHGRLPGTERPAHPPRPADRRATPLLQLHLPAGRLHQNLLRPLSPAERERPGTGEADAGNLRQPGQSGNFHFATKLHLLSATFAAENRK